MHFGESTPGWWPADEVVGEDGWGCVLPLWLSGAVRGEAVRVSEKPFWPLLITLEVVIELFDR